MQSNQLKLHLKNLKLAFNKFLSENMKMFSSQFHSFIISTYLTVDKCIEGQQQYHLIPLLLFSSVWRPNICNIFGVFFLKFLSKNKYVQMPKVVVYWNQISYLPQSWFSSFSFEWNLVRSNFRDCQREEAAPIMAN